VGAPTGSRLERALSQAVRGPVRFDGATRGRYATDASIYQIMPIGVVEPLDDDDLVTALEVARDFNSPVLARGAGSSQCGQTVGNALIVDVSRSLNAVLAFDAVLKTVTVEPGITLDALNAYLKPHGLWYPVDVSTSAQATLGGMAGNNSCGSRSLYYGNMVHNVEAIDAVLADGACLRFDVAVPETGSRMAMLRTELLSIMARHSTDIEDNVPKLLRRVGGYNIDLANCQSPRPYRADGRVNLAHLLVGSEGTLAFTRRLTLNLTELPATRVLGVANFASLREAMEATPAIVKLGPSAVELVDRTMIDLALSNPAFKPVISAALIGEPGALLLVEFSGESKPSLLARLRDLADLVNGRKGRESVVLIDRDKDQKALWEVRKAGLNIMMSMKGDGKPVSFIEDCAVPLEHLAEYTTRLSEVFARNGTTGTWYAHASVGTLHVRPILDMRREGAAKMRAIASEASQLVRELKGAYSGEHGDGLCRGEWIGWQFGPALSAAFRDIKTLLDPTKRFAPDKMLDAPRMDDAGNFRFSGNYRIISLQPALDWSAYDVTRDPVSGSEGVRGSARDPSGGLAMAIEMCNNNGHCRKFDTGTMCPSYRITRDETDVTRGRANTLRLALSGQLGEDGLAGEAVREALDLCVSCKGCRRECPTGVDMARIKIEVRAARLRRHGTSTRDKLIGWLPRYAPLITRSKPMSSFVNAAIGALPAARAAFGFAPERPFPAFSEAYTANMRDDARDRPSVVLWADTFHNHFEPHILADAREVLEAIGERVRVASAPGERPLCCGRTFLAQGDVTRARIEARRSLEVLAPLVASGSTVVGLEPSCLLTMRDEWMTMGLGEEAENVARRALLLGEFLALDHKGERLPPLFDVARAKERVLVHGHCHQKSFDAFDASLQALRQIPGLDPVPIDTSCCGMAGSFGLEKEHYGASLAMAELSLAPAIRQETGIRIVADGTSCRHQISHVTGRAALHSAEVFAEALRAGRN
jgi:FAD/FMN-containing dehydrogenase/Fe-S oxidoreductase